MQRPHNVALPHMPKLSLINLRIGCIYNHILTGIHGLQLEYTFVCISFLVPGAQIEGSAGFSTEGQ
jgi:hypothetical protein